jgi:putative transposase
LNDFWNIADECWRAIPEHIPHVELGAYVVMPNHVHGIIEITDSDVWATHASPIPNPSPLQNPSPPRSAPAGSLGAIVGSFKSAVSKRIHRQHNRAQVWQRNYYEHIIRDERELGKIWRYIESNPAQWDNDTQNSRRPPSLSSSD